MVSMGRVREWGSGYMEVHTVASTYVSVAKQGYPSCPCRVSLMSFQGFVACMGTGHSTTAARQQRGMGARGETRRGEARK